MQGLFKLLAVATVIGIVCFCCGVPYAKFANICAVLGLIGGIVFGIALNRT